MSLAHNNKFRTLAEIKKTYGDNLDGRMWIEGGYLCIREVGDTYDIALDRIDSPEKILRWVVQLSAKNWMSKKMLRDFVIGACTRINVSPFGC